MTTKSMCLLPWLSIATNADGSISPCCISSDRATKKDGSMFNLGYDKIEDIRNSEYFIELRRKMIAGELVPGCSTCYADESIGKISNRLLHMEERPGYIFPTSTDPDEIRYMDLRFGNLCNLACASCTPVSSSQLAKEVTNIKIVDPRMAKYFSANKIHINDWHETSILSDNINQNIDLLDKIYLTGGEPTIVSKNLEFLQLLVDSGKAANISVKLSTNLTNINMALIGLLKYFKEVRMFMSVDGSGKVQEYIRYPSKWSQISENIKTLAELPPSSIRLIPTPVIQATNLGSITELFDFYYQFDVAAGRRIFTIFPIVLSNPDFLDIQFLPREYKLECWDKIDNWLTKNAKFQVPLFSNVMASVRYRCLSNYTDTDMRDKFLEFTDIFDTARGTSLAEVNPELVAALAK